MSVEFAPEGESPMPRKSRALGGFTLYAVGEESVDWQRNAECRKTDPEAFFPEKGGSPDEAKRVCATCTVREACLAFALQHDERFGIWGGLTERERRRLKRKGL